MVDVDFCIINKLNIDKNEYIDYTTIKNTSQVTIDIKEETKYNRTFSNTRILSYILLNQCDTLLTYKKY